MAGKWPKKPPTGGHGYISTPVLRKACSEVIAGMEAASRVREQDNMSRQLSSNASATLPALPLPLEREHDDSDLAAPTAKRVAVETDQVQLLEDQLTRMTAQMQLLQAEVNTLEKQCADLIEDKREALRMAITHSIWASDILEGKIICAGAMGSAKIALDDDIKELQAMVRAFEPLYGKV